MPHPQPLYKGPPPNSVSKGWSFPFWTPHPVFLLPTKHLTFAYISYRFLKISTSAVVHIVSSSPNGHLHVCPFSVLSSPTHLHTHETVESTLIFLAVSPSGPTYNGSQNPVNSVFSMFLCSCFLRFFLPAVSPSNPLFSLSPIQF